MTIGGYSFFRDIPFHDTEDVPKIIRDTLVVGPVDPVPKGVSHLGSGSL